MKPEFFNNCEKYIQWNVIEEYNGWNSWEKPIITQKILSEEEVRKKIASFIKKPEYVLCSTQNETYINNPWWKITYTCSRIKSKTIGKWTTETVFLTCLNKQSYAEFMEYILNWKK